MKAVDTNILARYVLNDDAGQSRRATQVMREPVFISDTVLLEFAWLLSSRYGIGRAVLAAILQDLLSMPTVTVADQNSAAWAIDQFAAGADFADMLHLACARPAETFVSFERDLARKAGPNAPVRVEQPPA